ncbi:MAG: tyrosine--tRNA ligase [Candidatus Saccharibacteria bacterium]
MTLSEELVWRGLIKDKTFTDVEWLDTPQKFYLGIDPSADSLTVGNLAIITLCLRLARAGWGTFLVIGGGTSLVGDPGGKTEERQLMSRETIVSNTSKIDGQVSSLFRDEKFILVDNYDWLADLKYLEFLRDVGKYFSMTELMQRDFVTERMGAGGSGISYAEFSYSLVQGYDFWHLFKENDVVMQIGGSDQWGNLLSGTSLIRKNEKKEAQAMSMPLIINKTTGQKFGKSESGAVWLDPTKTTPTAFYQFWINSSDDGVEDYLKIYTFLTKEEIDELMSRHNSDPKARLAQKTLASEVTKLVHGDGLAKLAEAVTNYLTTEKDIAEATNEELDTIRKEISSIKFSPNTNLINILVSTGLAKSNSEAKSLIDGGAIYVKGQSYKSQDLNEDNFVNGRLLIRRGKAFRDSALIEL